MQNQRLPILCAFLLATGLSASAMAAELSAGGQKVVDYLLEDWSKRMHSTSIPQAMENLGMPPDEDLRLEIAEHFRQDQGLAGNIRAWGANNYLLSDQEKRIAKYLINTFNAEKRLPGLEDAAQALGIPPREVGRRLAFLARAGFLVKDSSSQPGYKLTEKYMRWGGPLRFNYHTIAIGDEHPFGVWWAVDFLLVVTSQENQDKKDAAFVLEDSCAHGHEPIRVEVKNGQITSLSPDTVWVQQGGG